MVDYVHWYLTEVGLVPLREGGGRSSFAAPLASSQRVPGPILGLFLHIL